MPLELTVYNASADSNQSFFSEIKKYNPFVDDIYTQEIQNEKLNELIKTVDAAVKEGELKWKNKTQNETEILSRIGLNTMLAGIDSSIALMGLVKSFLAENLVTRISNVVNNSSNISPVMFKAEKKNIVRPVQSSLAILINLETMLKALVNETRHINSANKSLIKSTLALAHEAHQNNMTLVAMFKKSSNRVPVESIPLVISLIGTLKEFVNQTRHASNPNEISPLKPALASLAMAQEILMHIRYATKISNESIKQSAFQGLSFEAKLLDITSANETSLEPAQPAAMRMG